MPPIPLHLLLHILSLSLSLSLSLIFFVTPSHTCTLFALRSTLCSPPLSSRYRGWHSDRSAEAVEAYARALEIRPGYIRSRYNLGISCINLKSYRDAAEHFLAALSLQQLATESSTQRNMSDTIWTSLRTTLSMANLPLLLRHATARDLDAFRGHFEF